MKMSERLEEDYRDTLSKLGDELTRQSMQTLLFLFPKVTRAQSSELESLRYNVASLEFFRILEDNEYLSLTNVDVLINALKKRSLFKAATVLENYKRRNVNLINAELQRQYEENQINSSEILNSSSASNSPVKTAWNTNIDTKKKIFISFSFKSLEKVTALKDRIERYIGKDSCWICTTGVRGGDNLDEEITQAITGAKIILCMINKDFVNSKECEAEVHLSRMKNKHFIPVLLEKVEWPLKKPNGDPSPMQLAFAQLLYVNLHDQTKKEEEFKKMISSIKEQLGSREQDAVGACGEGENISGNCAAGEVGQCDNPGSSGTKRCHGGALCKPSLKKKKAD